MEYYLFYAKLFFCSNRNAGIKNRYKIGVKDSWYKFLVDFYKILLHVIYCLQDVCYNYNIKFNTIEQKNVILKFTFKFLNL